MINIYIIYIYIYIYALLGCACEPMEFGLFPRHGSQTRRFTLHIQKPGALVDGERERER